MEKQKAEDRVGMKSQILRKANELMNEKGLVDFRVDELSTQIGVSPGNITYHFRRKEDLAYALWQEVAQKISVFFENIEKPFGLTELYSLLQEVYAGAYRYRGVVSSRLSGIAHLPQIGNEVFIRETYDNIIGLLVESGSLKLFKPAGVPDELFAVQLTLFCWAPFALNQGSVNVKKNASRYVKEVISPLYPFLSDKGLNEYNNIK